MLLARYTVSGKIHLQPFWRPHVVKLSAMSVSRQLSSDGSAWKAINPLDHSSKPLPRDFPIASLPSDGTGTETGIFHFGTEGNFFGSQRAENGTPELNLSTMIRHKRYRKDLFGPGERGAPMKEKNRHHRFLYHRSLDIYLFY